MAESLAEDRRARRQRKLDQIEIPAEHVTVSDELLGKGGFGAVYIADFNGRNAAVKVIRHRRLAGYCSTSVKRCSETGTLQGIDGIPYTGILLMAPLHNLVPPRSFFQVLQMDDHELGVGAGEDSSQQRRRRRRQRRAFLQELNVMIRLRSPHTVNVFGAITSHKVACFFFVSQVLFAWLLWWALQSDLWRWQLVY